MTTYTYTQTSVQLQANHNKVSATTGDLIDTNNLDLNNESLGYSKYTENKLKGNQNFNVAGSTGDPLPNGTPRTYTVGSELAAEIEVITNNAEQITYVSGILNSGNNTGIIRRRYTKDSAGLITKNNQYGGIKLSDGTQAQALVDDIATNGVRITEDGSDIVIDVDLSVITNGFAFFGLSDVAGVWQKINDEDSIDYIYNNLIRKRTLKNLTGSRSGGVTYTNEEPYPIDIYVSVTRASGNTIFATIDGNTNLLKQGAAVSTATDFSISAQIQPGSTYSINIGGGVIDTWYELRI